MKRFLMYSVSLIFALTLMFGATAQALTVTFDDYVKFAGTPAVPTFEATIVDTATGVQITMKNMAGTDAEKIFSWWFNIIPPIPGGLAVSYVSGEVATGWLLGEDIDQADGDGKFDLVFRWPTSGNTFDPGEQSVYDVTGSITAAQFLALSTPVGGQGPYYSAVEQSAWWGQGTVPEVVPEPYTLLLLGLGLVGVAGMRRFRK